MIDLARNGCSASFGELTRRNYDALHHWCVRFMGDPDEAEDVVQEVFLDAYQALSRFRGECRLNTWLFTIAKCKVSKLIRERSRRDRHRTLFSSFDFDVGEIPDHRPTQEEELIRQEQRRVTLAEMLESLPDKYAVPLRLSLQGMVKREIAAHLNRPEGTVKSRIWRGIELLKRKARDGNGIPTP
ncbi:MAG: sigma-70 family RNA polymerase sigma factor [Desulfomonilaceae bacterium]|nr:sigma-70 family RNA polymerase sigma factor [Desulfomonilaceae bacterium]